MENLRRHIKGRNNSTVIILKFLATLPLMLSTQSFIVLALSAATAAAQQCSYTPPPPSTSNGSSGSSSDLADLISPPIDSTPDVVTVSITDSLCFEPGSAVETTWSDVQGIIDGHNEKIE